MAEPERSMDGVVDAEFGGELRRFRLTVADLARLQAETGVGPGVIVGELSRAVQVLEVGAATDANGVRQVSLLQALALGVGDWKVEFVTRTIFHGLVRGGTAPNEAGKLVRQWIEERGFIGLLENVLLAWRVITGAAEGPEDDKVGEPAGATSTTDAPRSQTEKSASPSSTARPRRSAGARPTSPTPRSGSS